MIRIIFAFTIAALYTPNTPYNANVMHSMSGQVIGKYPDPYKQLLTQEFQYLFSVGRVARSSSKIFHAQITSATDMEIWLEKIETQIWLEKIETLQCELYELISKPSHNADQLIVSVQYEVDCMHRLGVEFYQGIQMRLNEGQISDEKIIKLLSAEISRAETERSALHDCLIHARNNPLAQYTPVTRSSRIDHAKEQIIAQYNHLFEQDICSIRADQCDVHAICEVLHIDKPQHELSDYDKQVLIYLYVFKLFRYAFQFSTHHDTNGIQNWSMQFFDDLSKSESINTTYENNKPSHFVKMHLNKVTQSTKYNSVTLCDHNSRNLVHSMRDKQLVKSGFLFHVYIQLLKNSLIHHYTSGDALAPSAMHSNIINLIDQIMCNPINNHYAREVLVVLLSMVIAGRQTKQSVQSRMISIDEWIENGTALKSHINSLAKDGVAIKHVNTYLRYAPCICRYLVSLKLVMRQQYYEYYQDHQVYPYYQHLEYHQHQQYQQYHQKALEFLEVIKDSYSQHMHYVYPMIDIAWHAAPKVLSELQECSKNAHKALNDQGDS